MTAYFTRSAYFGSREAANLRSLNSAVARQARICDIGASLEIRFRHHRDAALAAADQRARFDSVLLGDVCHRAFFKAWTIASVLARSL